jgi:uncharacterized cupredoxin-like copper-binding protein
MRTTPALIASLALGLLLTGCGGDGAAGSDDGSAADALTIVATEYEFTPTDVTIPADTPTDILLVNEGIVEHDWTIDELDIEIYAAAGESATATLTAAAGTYDIYCSIPGHRDLGMEGVLNVG